MIKESFAKRLKEALELRGVSQAELSKRTGINRSSISTYLKGEYKAKQDKVDLMAQALGVSPAWLMGFDIQPSGIPKLPHGAQLKKVPMLGYAAAGKPLEDLNQDVFYVDVENKYDVDFCITVAGDSMTGANIYDGDIVFIKKTSTVSNGQIACIQIDREKVCLKRFYKTGDTVQLISENPKYPPMLFTSQNCESLQILGLAIIKQSEVK